VRKGPIGGIFTGAPEKKKKKKKKKGREEEGSSKERNGDGERSRLREGLRRLPKDAKSMERLPSIKKERKSSRCGRS